MRLATILMDGEAQVVVVRDRTYLALSADAVGFDSIRSIAAGGAAGLARIEAWIDARPEDTWRSLDDVELGPAVPDPGAIYTIGLNYTASDALRDARPERPFVYGKLPTSVSGPGSVLRWDRSLTGNVDPEVELGVVIGETAFDVSTDDAMRHVFGFTCINDVSSRDEWLDGDQWLLGKSMAGFCPVGPWIVTRDELEPGSLRLGCTINGTAIQDGETEQMRFSIPEVISYLSRHTLLRPGDLIATGTPARLAGPLGPERHLEAGDVVTVWIEGIGELTTTIA